jgi:hypothetical protein
LLFQAGSVTAPDSAFTFHCRFQYSLAKISAIYGH